MLKRTKTRRGLATEYLATEDTEHTEVKKGILMKKKKGGFTLVELLVVIAVIALLMAILLPALSKARTQAKRIICLSGLKQLMTGWMAYADNHDGRIVNGGQAPPANATEPFWCTGFPAPPDLPSWDWCWEAGMWTCTAVLTYEQRVEQLKRGALFRYCNNVKSYRCPEGAKDMHRTYIMPVTMNAWCGNCGYPTGAESKVIKRVGQIKKSAERVVFFEEKEITPDAFQFNYNPTPNADWAWRDDDHPNIMHGDGANFGFADGHADFRKWECVETLSWIRNKYPLPLPTYGQCNKDLKWMHNAIWGITPQ